MIVAEEIKYTLLSNKQGHRKMSDLICLLFEKCRPNIW